MSERKVAELADWEKNFVFQQLAMLENKIAILRDNLIENSPSAAFKHACEISGHVHLIDVVLGVPKP